MILSSCRFFLSGTKVNQGTGNSKQSANQIEQKQTNTGIIEGHNSPLSANTTDSTENTTEPIIPKTTIEMSSPPVNTGITSEAKNTAEKLAKSTDSALNPDLESCIDFNIT